MPCGNCDWPVKGRGWMVVLETTDQNFQAHQAYFASNSDPMEQIYTQWGTPRGWHVYPCAIMCDCDQGRRMLESYRVGDGGKNSHPDANWFSYIDRTTTRTPPNSFEDAHQLAEILRKKLLILWPKDVGLMCEVT